MFPRETIRHIEKAKLWAVALVFLFVISLFDDLRFSITREKWDSWSFEQGMRYRQSSLEKENLDPKEGVWVSSRAVRLQERGEPNWWINAFIGLCLVQILRHLRKSCGSSELLRPAGSLDLDTPAGAQPSVK